MVIHVCVYDQESRSWSLFAPFFSLWGSEIRIRYPNTSKQKCIRMWINRIRYIILKLNSEKNRQWIDKIWRPSFIFCAEYMKSPAGGCSNSLTLWYNIAFLICPIIYRFRIRFCTAMEWDSLSFVCTNQLILYRFNWKSRFWNLFVWKYLELHLLERESSAELWRNSEFVNLRYKE